MKKVSCALTIAGTDPTGGAGIQADLKTFEELKSYGMSVITSVVAQNTTGVQELHHIPLSMLSSQLNSVFSDMPVHAVKTGMIADKEMMQAVAQYLQEGHFPYVMDPVMVATSGDALIAENSRLYLRDHLLPLTTLVTPNIHEAVYLTGKKIETTTDMQEAAKLLVDKYGAGAALIKGGHMKGDAVDFLYDGKEMHTFTAKRIETENTHGTGCTYSAAVTAFLSQGMPLLTSVRKAKMFVTAAIRNSFDIGNGNGPTNHWAAREEMLFHERETIQDL
ncbi:bifunctional hydroxymethylpyrimidine kinase/phosphomethylpyrimidine kinase [Virgibacillus halophilus]|uniref:Hydroxymethylpyrimidine/phosphomethylpyrimidine kinase n=1 Tax=Tigheibacillus halophilus TaxID=361280 RepID=A0ABU5CAT7_9BACI|nr:bifunctional hydroxymethylpyrimidine kinase/phosphomethylpyrimidine kinase [Virgibacillus halophilus]